MSTSHFLPAWHITFPATCHMEDRAESTAYNGCRTDGISFAFCPQHDIWNFMLQDLCSTGAWHVGILLTSPSPLSLYFAFTCTHILYVTFSVKTVPFGTFGISRNTILKHWSHCSSLVPCFIHARFTRGASRIFMMGFPSVRNYRNILDWLALISCWQYKYYCPCTEVG